MGTCSFFTKPEQHVAMPGGIGGVVLSRMFAQNSIEYRRWKWQIVITVSHAPGKGSAAIEDMSFSFEWRLYNTLISHIHAKFNKMCSQIDITYYFKGSEAVNCWQNFI